MPVRHNRFHTHNFKHIAATHKHPTVYDFEVETVNTIVRWLIHCFFVDSASIRSIVDSAQIQLVWSIENGREERERERERDKEREGGEGKEKERAKSQSYGYGW